MDETPQLPAEPVERAVGHPVRIVVTDDLRRSRLTVFFRLLLAIPHFVWLALWTIAALLVAIANWLATLVSGVPPEGLHRFLASYVRYATHVNAYLLLAGNPFPGFVGEPGSYPVDLELDPPERQNRWTVFFRLFLALPAGLVSSALYSPFGQSGDAASTTSIFGWFASLVRGRMPEGFRDVEVYALRYSAQTWAYGLVLTGRYPNSDPGLERAAPARDHPIALTVTDDLHRSRLTVFFRLLLAIPHIVWLLLWTIAVWLAVIVAWFAAVFTGWVPEALHRFISAFIRYQSHVSAYVLLTANQFPGFTGTPGYAVDAVTPVRERQNRWTVGFRLVLVLPALVVEGALGGVALVAALLGWFVALALGRMPVGFRNVSAYAIRYGAQTDGYLYLLTDRYPFSGPPA